MILRRREDGWWIQMHGREIRLDLEPHALVVEAVGLVRARYSFARLGVCAKDLGPAAELAALTRGGGGDVIWLRR